MDPTIRFYRRPSGGTIHGEYNFEQFAIYSNVQTNFPFLDYNFVLRKIGGCGAGNFTTSIDLELEYNDLVEIWLDNELKYAGYITDIPEVGTRQVYAYEMAGYSTQLTWPLLQSYTINLASLNSAVRDLLADEIYGANGIPTDISDDTSQINIPTMIGDWDTQIQNLEFVNKTPADILDVLKNLAGPYEYGVDAQRRLYFRPKNPDFPADETTQHKWWVGKGVKDFEPDKNSLSIANYLYVDIGRMSDGNNFYSEYKDDISINKYGQRKKPISIPDSFPLYSGDDVLFELAGVSSVPTGTDIVNITDGDPTTYWDSDEDQGNGVILWNKLESASGETVTSERGSDGKTVGSPTFAAAKFNNGIVVSNGNYITFDDDDLTIDQGAIDFWWKAPRGRDDGGWVSGNNYFWAIIAGNLKLYGGYNTTSKKFFLLLDYYQTYYAYIDAPAFATNDLLHLGFTWAADGRILGPMLKGNLQVAQGAVWVTEDSASFDASSFGYLSHQYGWASKAIDYDRLYIGANEGGTASPGGVIDNLKVYDEIKVDFSDQDTEDANEDKQYVQVDFEGDYKKIGQIRICSIDDENTDNYARGVKVRVRRAAIAGPGELEWTLDQKYWETVYAKASNNEGDLLITLNPYPMIDAIRVYSTGDSDEHWRVYQLSANEFLDSDVAQWANNQLDNLKDPEEKATLTLDGVTSVPEPRGKCIVTDNDGVEYEYEIVVTGYSSSGDTVRLQLGDIPLSVPDQLRAINRQMLENQYVEQKNAQNISSGDGMQDNSIGPGQIDHIIADQVTTGTLKSRNYSTTDGMMINLDEASMYIREADGLKITSGGGVQIFATDGTAGSIRGGQTAYDTGTGWWIGLDGATPKFSIGNSAANKLTWNGSILAITGEVSSGGNLTVKSGGDIIIEAGGDLIFSGASSSWYLDTSEGATWTNLSIYPDNASGTARIRIGSDGISNYATQVLITGTDSVYIFSTGQTYQFAPNVFSCSISNPADIGYIGQRFKDLYLNGTANMTVLKLWELSADPAEPTGGRGIIWISDGTGKGDAGDIMIASDSGGGTKYTTLFDYSGGTPW